jgi:hypothetical protein
MPYFYPIPRQCTELVYRAGNRAARLAGAAS